MILEPCKMKIPVVPEKAVPKSAVVVENKS